MKQIFLVISILFLISCLKNSTEITPLKYSKDDLIPLSDSLKSIYYEDAAYIEFRLLIQDTIKRNKQVRLNEQNIIAYQNDLIRIYNSCYTISNTFFERISFIHNYDRRTLYQIFVSVDISKAWVNEWLIGNKYTGVVGIDSVISNYDLTPQFLFTGSKGHYFTISSKATLNYYALINKLARSNEFVYLGPDAIIESRSSISLKYKNNYKFYNFTELLDDFFKNRINDTESDYKNKISSIVDLCKMFSINNNIYNEKYEIINIAFSEIEYNNSLKIT